MTYLFKTLEQLHIYPYSDFTVHFAFYILLGSGGKDGYRIELEVGQNPGFFLGTCHAWGYWRLSLLLEPPLPLIAQALA